MYVMPDTTAQFIDIDSLGHMETEYGIFVSDAGKDQENIRQAKELSQAMIQNGMPASAVLDLFDTENFTGIKDKLQKAEKAQQELAQAQQQAEMQQKQMEMQMKQQEVQMMAAEKDKDRQKDIEIALINAEAKDESNRLNIDLQKIMQDYDIKQKEIEVKKEALQKEGDTEANGK